MRGFPRASEITYYEELGVASDASSEEIRDAFRALVRLLHPDQQTDEQLKDIAENQMRKLNRIYAVLGGTHLGLSPEPQFDPTIRALREFDIRMLAVSHCTGQGPVARLASEFGDKFAFGRVGFVLEV